MIFLLCVRINCGMLGNPIGGLVFTTAFGQLEQLHEWTNFMSSYEFCLRGCKPQPQAPELCQHMYDDLGCMWNMPANYDAGVFEKCQGDSAEVNKSFLMFVT